MSCNLKKEKKTCLVYNLQSAIHINTLLHTLHVLAYCHGVELYDVSGVNDGLILKYLYTFLSGSSNIDDEHR